MKNIFKRRIKQFLVAMLLVCFMIIGAGCPMGPDINGDFDPTKLTGDFSGAPEISGIKTCYKPSTIDFARCYKDYTTKIINNLADKYGKYNESEWSNLANISFQIVSGTNNTSLYKIEQLSWKWIPAADVTGIKNEFSGEISQEFIKEKMAGSLKGIVDSIYDQWASSFNNCLQIVTYEILLGYTPTIFPSVEEVNRNLFQYSKRVDELVSDYAHKGSYVGLTQANKQALKQYILDNVIGSQVVTKYNLARGYSDAVENIVNNAHSTLEEEIKAAFLNPYPASYIKDYEANLFFVGIGKQPFAHIPAMEYQSLMLMPNTEKELSTVFLSFESTYDISVRVGIRAYDKSKNSLFEKNYGVFNIKGGEFDWTSKTSMIEFPCQDNSGKQAYYPLTNFDNNFDSGTFKTIGVSNGYKKLTRMKESGHNYATADFYKLRESQNIFGGSAIINEKIFQENDLGNFYEVYFDIIKSPTDPPTKAYAFKVGFSGIYFSK